MSSRISSRVFKASWRVSLPNVGGVWQGDCECRPPRRGGGDVSQVLGDTDGVCLSSALTWQGRSVERSYSGPSISMPRRSIAVACWLVSAASAVFLEGFDQKDVDCAACMAVGDELTRALLKEKASQNLDLQSHRVRAPARAAALATHGARAMSAFFSHSWAFRGATCSSALLDRIDVRARPQRLSITR